MKIRRPLLALHRWLSLAVLGLWVVQAITGMFAVFHWEIDDALVPGEHRPTDFRAIERSLAAIATPGSGVEVSSIWTTAGAAERYDVNLSDRVVRIDGAGRTLRVRKDGERIAHGGFVETVVTLHHDLLAGDAGCVLIGVSGCLLLTNVMIGVVLARPRARRWAAVLKPGGGTRTAVLYSWHRAIGLWFAVPLFLLAGGGVLLAFEGWTERALDGGLETPVVATPAPRNVGMADAVTIALRRFPGAAVSGIGFPSGENAVWRITLKQRGELRRAYGRTRVFVSASDGTIVKSFDVLRATTGQRVFHSLFAFHAGEMGGLATRLVVLLTGASLLALIVAGVLLWCVRRPRGRLVPR